MFADLLNWTEHHQRVDISKGGVLKRLWQTADDLKYPLRSGTQLAIANPQVGAGFTAE